MEHVNMRIFLPEMQSFILQIYLVRKAQVNSCEQHNRNQREKAKAITQIPFETIRLVLARTILHGIALTNTIQSHIW